MLLLVPRHTRNKKNLGERTESIPPKIEKVLSVIANDAGLPSVFAIVGLLCVVAWNPGAKQSPVAHETAAFVWGLIIGMLLVCVLVNLNARTHPHTAVIMGRKTWESLPVQVLPNRWNIVVTRHPENIKVKHEHLLIAKSFRDALFICSNLTIVNHAYIIGGNEIYAAALDSTFVSKLYLTRVPGKYTCDTFFPPIDRLEWDQTKLYDLGNLKMEIYKKRNFVSL